MGEVATTVDEDVEMEEEAAILDLDEGRDHRV